MDDGERVWVCVSLKKVLMTAGIIFIGGIHGVGKGKICQDLSHEIGVYHLSASAVLKWEEVSPDIRNKTVEDIPYTQDRLVTNLRKIINPSTLYLLDGHYCLFDSAGKVTPVPLSTFQDIHPVVLIVAIGGVDLVQHRLLERDGREYSLANLREMQTQEVAHAEKLAVHLQVPLLTIRDQMTAEAINFFKKMAW